MLTTARTVGAVDVDPSLPIGRVQVPQDAAVGVILGMTLGTALTILPILPGWWKVLGILAGMTQVTVSLWRVERVSGWKLLAAHMLRDRLPNKLDKDGRFRERMRLLPDGGREVLSSRPVREREWLAVPDRVQVVADGLIESPDRGYMVVLKYTPPAEHWGSEEHERWARRMVNTLRQLGGSQQLFTRIRRVDSTSLRTRQAQAIRESLSRSRVALPDAAVMVEAELDHVEELAQEMYVVDHFLVLHPARDGLWAARWETPPRASLDDVERLLTSSLLALSKSGIRMQKAPMAEIESAVVAGVNGGEEAYADYRRGGVSTPDGERRVVALSRPPREMLPGSLMESCGRIDAHSIVITTRLAVVTEFEALRHLKKVARDYRDSRRHQGDASEDVAAQTAIEDVEAVIQEIFLERASSWRWQTLIEFSASPGEADAVLQSLVAELTEMRWKPEPLRLWPLHAHSAAALGGGALKRFELLMPSLAAAYALPVMGMPFSDPSAPVLGRNELTGTPVSLDLTREHTGQPGASGNRNLALVGPTGSGKTTTLGMIIGALASRGQGALVLDYHSEVGRLVEAYGGLSLELADTAVNPFAVVGRAMTLEQRELLKESVGILAADRLPGGQRGLTPEEESWLSEAVDWYAISDELERLRPSLGNQEGVADLEDLGPLIPDLYPSQEALAAGAWAFVLDHPECPVDVRARWVKENVLERRLLPYDDPRLLHETRRLFQSPAGRDYLVNQLRPPLSINVRGEARRWVYDMQVDLLSSDRLSRVESERAIAEWDLMVLTDPRVLDGVVPKASVRAQGKLVERIGNQDPQLLLEVVGPRIEAGQIKGRWVGAALARMADPKAKLLAASLPDLHSSDRESLIQWALKHPAQPEAAEISYRLLQTQRQEPRPPVQPHEPPPPTDPSSPLAGPPGPLG